MDTKLQNSFIPKRPIVTSKPGRSAGLSSPVGFFGLVVLLVVGVAVIGSAGVFFYKTYLISARVDLDQQLVSARATLDSDTLNELMKVGKRLSIAQDLLSKHVSVSSFFEFLEANTVQRIQFNDFKYSVDPRKSVLVVDMAGKSPDYTTLLFQSDTLSQRSDVKDVTFSQLDLDNDGDVTFSLKLTLEPSKFLFKDNLTSISLGFPY